MAILFPALCPTERQFTCADYPLTDGAWKGGVASFPRAWSDTPMSAALRLGFRNIPDVSAAQLLTCWRNSFSGIFPLVLPEEIVGGIDDPDLRARILSPPGLEWRFKEQPKVSSVMPGFSSVLMQLMAEAEQQLLLVL